MKSQQNEDACFQKHYSVCIFPQGFSILAYWNFIEKFCEHEQASTRPIVASNSSKAQILRALLNWMGPFDTTNAVIQFLFEPPLFHNKINSSLFM